MVTSPSNISTVAGINARIDRLPQWGLGRSGIVVFGATFFFTYWEIVCHGLALPTAQFALHMSRVDTALPSSINLAGYVVGAYIGVLADRLGRRRALVFSILIQGPASVLTALAWDPISFTVFRGLTGIGTGALLAVVTTYVAEAAPAALRGRYTQYAIVFAGCSHPVTGLTGALLVSAYPAWGWRALYGVGALILLLLPLMGVIRLPESPRWLAVHGKPEAADAVVRRWERYVSTRGIDLADPPVSPEESGARNLPVRDILRKPYVSRLVIILVFWLLWYVWVYGFLGYQAILLVAMGKNASSSVLYVALGEFGAVASTIVPIFLIDRVERKYLIAALVALGSVGLIVIATASGSVGFIIGSLIVTAVTSGGSLAFGYTAEIFPTRARATGMAIADGIGHLGGVVAPYVALGLLAATSARGVFWVWAVLAIAGAVLILVAGRRTSGVALTEIAK